MDADGDGAWFDGLDLTNEEVAARSIARGEAASPRDWPALAVETGVVTDEATYYRRLQAIAIAAAREAVSRYEGADDRQVVHAVNTMDDLDRTANELAERVAEWAGSLGHDDIAGPGDVARLADREPAGMLAERLHDVAQTVVRMREDRNTLASTIERTVPEFAPNLSEMAGPILSARLIALAGDLERLAKLPSGTVQVLGAEDALFAHLEGHAPSPKHGVIFTHEYVRGTPPAHRGSAARALAGKLSIAARIDHYSGDYRPEIHAALDERIARIQERDA